MASYNIPSQRSKATPFTADTSVALGGRENQVMKFFSNIMPGIFKTGQTAPPTTGDTGLFGRWRSDITYSDLMHGVSETIFNQIETLLISEDTWYFDVAPVREVTGLKVNWQITTFAPKIPTVVPPHSRVRLLEVSKSKGQSAMTRRGIGFALDDETLDSDTPQGREIYSRWLNMTNQSVIEGDKLAVVWGILSANRQKTRYYAGGKMYRDQGMEKVLVKAATMFMSAVKDPLPIETWVSTMREDMRREGVSTQMNAVWIVHTHILNRMSSQKERYTRYFNNGDKGWQVLMDGLQAFTTFHGEPVYPARSFVNANGELDLFKQAYTLGLYYVADNPLRDMRNIAYDRALRAITITDCHNRDMRTIEIDAIRRNSGRWNIGPGGTGDLNSVQRPQEWSALIPAKLQSMMTEVGKPDIWHDPDQGFREPVSVMGSSIQFSGEDFVNAINAFQKSWPADRLQLYNDALDTIYAAITEIEAQPYDKDILEKFAGRALNKQTPQRDGDSSGCYMPVNEVERSSTNGVPTGMVPVIARGGGNVPRSKLPPFFGHYSGLRALVLDKTVRDLFDDSVKAKLDKIKLALDTVDQMARHVSDAFKHSVLLGPAHAPPEHWDANVASQIVDALVPSRPAIWVSGAGAPAEVIDQIRPIYTALQSALDASKKLPDGKKIELDAADRDVEEKLKSAIYVTTLANSLKADIVRSDYQTLAQLAKDADSNKTFDALKAKYRSELAFTKVEQVKAAIASVARNDDNKNIARFARTPLWISPTQLDELKAAAPGNFTVSHDLMPDIPVPPADLKDAQFIYTNRKLSVAQYIEEKDKHAFRAGRSISRILQILNQQQLPTDVYTIMRGPIRAGVQSQRALGMEGRPETLDILRAIEGGNTTSTTQSAFGAVGARASTQRLGNAQQLFGCVDARVLHMVNSPFVLTWNRIADLVGDGDLATLVLARAYMTTTTNYYQGVERLERKGIPMLDKYYILRTLHGEAYPVIRMIPGEQTMFLMRQKDMMHWGTDPNTGIFGLSLTYYSGVAIPSPQNIHREDAVDPAEYKFGMGTEWRDLAKHAREPHRDQEGGRDLIAIAVPYSQKSDPFVLNPAGVIRLLHSNTDGNDLALTTPIGIEAFENLRCAWSDITISKLINPNSPVAGVTNPDYTSPVYYKDTTYMLASADSTQLRVAVTTQHPIPSSMANPNLRTVLDGGSVIDPTVTIK